MNFLPRNTRNITEIQKKQTAKSNKGCTLVPIVLATAHPLKPNGGKSVSPKLILGCRYCSLPPNNVAFRLLTALAKACCGRLTAAGRLYRMTPRFDK
jgi:hypothetical protein